MSSLSGKMAQWALDLKFEDIPEESIWEAKRFLLDSVGCALAAVKNEDMEAMYRFTEKLGGTPEASVIGRDYKTNASNAALMNCLLTRAMDYNDIYWEEDPSHPSDLIGTALASGEVNGKNGKEVLEAIIIDYELMLRWCHAAHPGVREIGWHHASLVQFVSPVVAGKLYDLDLEQMVAAVGISSSSHFSSGHGEPLDKLFGLAGQVGLAVVSALKTSVQTAVPFTSDLNESSRLLGHRL